MDLDNNKLYFIKMVHKLILVVPTSGTTNSTGAIILLLTLDINRFWFFTSLHGLGKMVLLMQLLANFGNGYFGTTAVSSAGTNASNNGIFEYDVPSRIYCFINKRIKRIYMAYTTINKSTAVILILNYILW